MRLSYNAAYLITALLGVRDNQRFASAGGEVETVFWEQFGQTIPGEPGDNGGIGEYFGSAVATSRDGRTIVVSGMGRTNVDGDYAAGYAKVFKYNEAATFWRLLGGPICGEDPNDAFGESVAISGDGNIIAIGTSRPDSLTGEVRVFRLIRNVWEPLGSTLVGDCAGDEHGFAVSLSNNGDIVAVGTPGPEDGAGRVRVYKYDVNVNDWERIGQDIEGAGYYEYTGWSLELSKEGGTIVVGGPYHIEDNYYAGRGRVFDYDAEDDLWNQLGGDLLGEFYDEYGLGVSISDNGRIVAISAGCYYYCGFTGDFLSVYKYDDNSADWEEYGPPIYGGEEGYSSPSLSGDGNTVAYASYANTNFTDRSYGRVHVKEFVGGADSPKWLDVAQNIGVADYERYPYTRFVSLSKDGNVLLVGSSDDDTYGFDQGSATAYKLSTQGTPAGCVDSVLPIAFNGNLITCQIIGQGGFCGRPQTNSHCPKTCSDCLGDNACADSIVPFKFGNNQETCESNLEYCLDESYALTCRATCFNPMCDTLGLL